MNSTILIVEDDRGLLKYLVELLRLNGYEAFGAKDGIEALKYLKKSKPNLIIMDLVLPRISGESVIREIRKEHDDIPIIILSAKDTIKQIVEGLNYGADDYITKPFVADELLARIKARLHMLPPTESSGYIKLSLPDSLRSMFTDLLKGFEEFSRLKGYPVTFSVDNSTHNIIAFKFSLQDKEANISEQTIREDIKEYIERVRDGKNFDDLPSIISNEEHSLVVTELKNRISMIQHNYNLEKNTRIHYEKLFKSISKMGFQTQQIYIQGSGNYSNKSLEAVNSNNLFQGEDENSNQSDSSVHSAIYIANSFNKRREQVDKIGHLIKLLEREKNINQKIKQKIILNFEKVKHELQEKETPNKKNIYWWMVKAKGFLKNMVLSHETYQAIIWIYNNLKLVAPIVNG